MIDAAQTATMSLEVRLADYRPQVRRHILAMVRDAGLADELTQDTYTRALERVDQLRDPQAGLAWLYRIATTVTLDRLRQRRPTTVPLDSENLSPEVALTSAAEGPSLIETALERSDMSECVQSYLETLPDDYRVAILLHDAYGLPNPEISRLLGCTLATTKIRVHRARNRLRETLAAACAFDVDERGVLVCDPLR